MPTILTAVPKALPDYCQGGDWFGNMRDTKTGTVGPHIGRYCGQTSPGRVISYTGILSMTITTDNAIAKEGFSANYTIRERNLPLGHADEVTPFRNVSVYRGFLCMEPLGMESGEITSDQISASTQYNSNWSHERSRLNYHENGWTPSDDSAREWIQLNPVLRCGLCPGLSYCERQELIEEDSQCLSQTLTFFLWWLKQEVDRKPAPVLQGRTYTDCRYSRRWRRSSLSFSHEIHTSDLLVTRSLLQPEAGSYRVDLGFLRFVTAIGTQGAISKETKKHYFVRSYKVDLSSNDEDWVTVKVGSKQKIFQGNFNPTDEFRSVLPKPTLARYVRIRPMSWEQGICMRFEIYGCRTSDYPCSGMLGMVSGLITDAQINASSYADRGWVAENARLLTGRSGWTGQQTKQPFRNEWLQVDLGKDKMVSGVVIQGGKHRDRNVFMKKFKLGHSLDGEAWTFVNEDNSTKPKEIHVIFQDSTSSPRPAVLVRHPPLCVPDGRAEDEIFSGNQNHDTPELRSMGPFMTRFVRIYPERATNEGLGLRLELLGCELDEITTTTPTTPVAPTLPMTTFGATTTAPTTVPGTTLTTDCEEGQQDCYRKTEIFEEYDTVTAGTTATDPILDLLPAYVWFACNFDFSSFCGWTRESGTEAEWLIQSNGAPAVHRGPNLDHTGRPGNFIYMQLSDTDTPSKTGEDEDEGEKVARLSSLPILVLDTDLCMSFWYHMFGEHAGALHIKQRKEEEEVEQILWTVRGHQGSRWREGRVLLPHSSVSYQMVVEGVADRRSTGHIAVDNIQVIDGINTEDCKDPEAFTSASTSTSPIIILPIDPRSEETSELGGSGNMLKTLDPILITIIAMSALGVFLGAICGVVLYCACSQGSMTDRNLSALENYNFELVDGVKLKKDKMNGQTNYSEA
ncbi:hypothetical protein PAMP_005285 [Pampus punctatissimus]